MGKSERGERPGKRAMCGLCNEREADPTVAVFVGGLCCRACAEDIDAQLGGVEPSPLPFEYGYQPARVA